MNFNFGTLQPLDFRLRKIVHYSLIICVLLIQIMIAAFFYTEFINRKNTTFIENQLKELNSVENLTNNSRKELLNAQNFLQKYLVTQDNQYLDSYFNSVNKLTNNLDQINHSKYESNHLKNALLKEKKDSIAVKNLKSLIDSTNHYSTKTNMVTKSKLPKIERYTTNYTFDKYDVKTEKYTDTIKKKGLFGRLSDAISGKETIRKDSTVVTLKKGSGPDFVKMKSEVDSILNSVNNHYTKEIKKIQVNVSKNQDNGNQFYKIFNNLLIYSNELINVYEFAVKDSRIQLENELAKQNSDNEKIRMYLVSGLMVLMFIVSILIMYFTRLAFQYEKKLSAANKQIKENLTFKNRILGMLSHELRSPLKIISIFIKRIDKKTEDANVKEYLKSINFTTNTLLMQANQILEYTKNQQVENKLIPVEFNLNKEIQYIITAIEPYISTRNNQFIVDKDIDEELMVYSDNTKINQLYMNILGNANKFTENGKISIKVTTENIDENTIRLHTKMCDTGVGVAKSDLEKIFNPYFQGVLSADVENLGAGLGLSLCKEIVELFSGYITISSELGVGTTVDFSLNLKLKK